MSTINYNYLPGFDPATYRPVFDPTGLKPENRVTNEQHTVTAATQNSQHFLMPLFAPFFGTGLVLRIRESNGGFTPLVEGVDYHFGFPYLGATRSTGKPLYGSIVLLNKNLSGVLDLAYNTVGGNYVLNLQEISRILADALVNPRVTSWENVIERPITFPVIDHEWNLNDMVGMSAVVSSLEDIAAAIADQDPVVVTPPEPIPTKALVGLGNVQNYGVATLEEAAAGLSEQLYMTPKGTKHAFQQFFAASSPKISEEDGNRAALGPDNGIFVPELTLRPLTHYLSVRQSGATS